MILREEKLKREKSVEVQKTGIEKSSKSMKKKKKLLRKVMVKIELKQEDNKEGIVVEALLDSSATKLVMSSEFARKNRFSRSWIDQFI